MPATSSQTQRRCRHRWRRRSARSSGPRPCRQGAGVPVREQQQPVLRLGLPAGNDVAYGQLLPVEGLHRALLLDHPVAPYPEVATSQSPQAWCALTRHAGTKGHLAFHEGVGAVGIEERRGRTADLRCGRLFRQPFFRSRGTGRQQSMADQERGGKVGFMRVPRWSLLVSFSRMPAAASLSRMASLAAKSRRALASAPELDELLHERVEHLIVAGILLPDKPSTSNTIVLHELPQALQRAFRRDSLLSFTELMMRTASNSSAIVTGEFRSSFMAS